jgi:hypothetical protein
VTASRTIRLLWHDDELDGPRSQYVAPWRNWFERLRPPFSVTYTSSLAGFAAALNQPNDFQLLVLDVMLKRERDTDFRALGFERERILRLDAGAQIAGLLRNPVFSLTRPDWLRRYSRTTLVLLTSTPTVADLIRHYVDADLRAGVHGIGKSHGDTVTQEFDVAMQALLKQFESG